MFLESYSCKFAGDEGSSESLTGRFAVEHRSEEPSGQRNAVQMHNTMLAMRLKTLGEDHPDTIVSMSNLADALSAAAVSYTHLTLPTICSV